MASLAPVVGRTQTAEKYSLDPKRKSLFMASSILLVSTGVIWAVVARLSMLLYPSGVPTGAESYLKLVSQNQVLAASDWSLWIVADLLIVLPTIALYFVLSPTNKTLALVGTALALVFPIYDIPVSELNSLMLVSLAHGYANAPTAALQAPYIAAAASRVAALPVETFVSFALSIGFLVLSFAMLKSVFRKGIAILGIVANGAAVVGSVSALVPASGVLGLLFFISVPAGGLWLILVGFQLHRYTMRLTIPQLTSQYQ